MPKITLENGKEIVISQESYDELAKAVKKPTRPWRAEHGESYWCLSTTGKILKDHERGGDADWYRHLTGNYFETAEEARSYLKRQLAIGRVTHAIFEANDGWEPDWSNNLENKYYIYYDHKSEEFSWHFTAGEEESYNYVYIRTEEIADTIIENHEADLKIIWRVN